MAVPANVNYKDKGMKNNTHI